MERLFIEVSNDLALSAFENKAEIAVIDTSQKIEE